MSGRWQRAWQGTPSKARGSEAGKTTQALPRLLRIVAWIGATPLLLVALAWIVGQLARDEWRTLQRIFWIPSLVAATCALSAYAALRVAGGSSRAARHTRRACAFVALLALGHTAWHDFGWRAWPAEPQHGSFVVTHWNARWPGRDALECGRALAPEMGDVAIISNPGSMARADVAELWLPKQAQIVDRGPVAVVTRWPVLEFRVLAIEVTKEIGQIWIARLRVQAPDDKPLEILVVDLPSSPDVSRREVAAAAGAILARAGETPEADLIVGDLNCTPGSVVFSVIAPLQCSAPPWAASGWLATFPRERPMWRIDAMLAAPTLEWVRYQTLDLGLGAHRAQRGAFTRAPNSAQ